MPSRADRNQTAAAPVPPTSQASPKPPRGRGRGVALGLLLLVATLYAASHMDQGIDTWISLAGGRDVAAHGVRLADPFSFNSRPPSSSLAGEANRLWSWLHPSGWINQNWLTHLLLFELQRIAGLDALVVWKLLNYLLAAAVLVAAARVRGAAAIPAVAAACAALVVSRDYLSMRGQDVTNLLIAILLLAVALTQRRNPRWAWALVPIFAVWGNAHGGFVYGLVILAIIIAGAWLAGAGASRKDEPGRPRLLALAGAAAAATTVVLSPYRLANLTHPLVISLGADAPLWRVVREWRPLFSNPLSSPIPFLVFVAVTVLALAVRGRGAARRIVQPLDVAGVVVVLSAFALAVASARFVPLACFTAAPFVACWLDDATASIGAGVFGQPAHRRIVRVVTDLAIWVAAATAAVAFAVRADRTYGGPWPQDTLRTGLFDRMTHSHQRPWGPCAFLAANGVSGRMWNFWDEGGFLASCQRPDPASGSPPVEIFIDGRAQAAYDPEALRSYLDLLNGPGRSGQAGASAVAVPNLEALRSWTAQRLRELDVWIALVPASHQKTAFARAAAAMPGWHLVYIDAEHSMFVDTESVSGRSLAERVSRGAARYPDEASAKLTAAFRLLPARSEDEQRRAIELAEQSYGALPSRLAVLCATSAARSPEAAGAATSFCRNVAEEFAANRDRHRAAAGYAVRLDAATTALEYLATSAKKAGQADLLRWAASWLTSCRAEEDALAEQVLW